MDVVGLTIPNDPILMPRVSNETDDQNLDDGNHSSGSFDVADVSNHSGFNKTDDQNLDDGNHSLGSSDVADVTNYSGFNETENLGTLGGRRRVANFPSTEQDRIFVGSLKNVSNLPPEEAKDPIGLYTGLGDMACELFTEEASKIKNATVKLHAQLYCSSVEKKEMDQANNEFDAALLTKSSLNEVKDTDELINRHELRAFLNKLKSADKEKLSGKTISADTVDQVKQEIEKSTDCHLSIDEWKFVRDTLGLGSMLDVTKRKEALLDRKGITLFLAALPKNIDGVSTRDQVLKKLNECNNKYLGLEEWAFVSRELDAIAVQWTGEPTLVTKESNYQTAWKAHSEAKKIEDDARKSAEKNNGVAKESEEKKYTKPFTVAARNDEIKAFNELQQLKFQIKNLDNLRLVAKLAWAHLAHEEIINELEQFYRPLWKLGYSRSTSYNASAGFGLGWKQVGVSASKSAVGSVAMVNVLDDEGYHGFLIRYLKGVTHGSQVGIDLPLLFQMYLKESGGLQHMHGEYLEWNTAREYATNQFTSLIRCSEHRNNPKIARLLSRCRTLANENVTPGKAVELSSLEEVIEVTQLKREYDLIKADMEQQLALLLSAKDQTETSQVTRDLDYKIAEVNAQEDAAIKIKDLIVVSDLQEPEDVKPSPDVIRKEEAVLLIRAKRNGRIVDETEEEIIRRVATDERLPTGMMTSKDVDLILEQWKPTTKIEKLKVASHSSRPNDFKLLQEKTRKEEAVLLIEAKRNGIIVKETEEDIVRGAATDEHLPAGEMGREEVDVILEQWKALDKSHRPQSFQGGLKPANVSKSGALEASVVGFSFPEVVTAKVGIGDPQFLSVFSASGTIVASRDHMVLQVVTKSALCDVLDDKEKADKKIGVNGKEVGLIDHMKGRIQEDYAVFEKGLEESWKTSESDEFGKEVLQVLSNRDVLMGNSSAEEENDRIKNLPEQERFLEVFQIELSKKIHGNKNRSEESKRELLAKVDILLNGNEVVGDKKEQLLALRQDRLNRFRIIELKAKMLKRSSVTGWSGFMNYFKQKDIEAEFALLNESVDYRQIKKRKDELGKLTSDGSWGWSGLKNYFNRRKIKAELKQFNCKTLTEKSRSRLLEECGLATRNESKSDRLGRQLQRDLDEINKINQTKNEKDLKNERNPLKNRPTYSQKIELTASAQKLLNQFHNLKEDLQVYEKMHARIAGQKFKTQDDEIMLRKFAERYGANNVGQLLHRMIITNAYVFTQLESELGCIADERLKSDVITLYKTRLKAQEHSMRSPRFDFDEAYMAEHVNFMRDVDFEVSESKASAEFKIGSIIPLVPELKIKYERNYKTRIHTNNFRKADYIDVTWTVNLIPFLNGLSAGTAYSDELVDQIHQYIHGSDIAQTVMEDIPDADLANQALEQLHMEIIGQVQQYFNLVSPVVGATIERQIQMRFCKREGSKVYKLWNKRVLINKEVRAGLTGSVPIVIPTPTGLLPAHIPYGFGKAKSSSDAVIDYYGSETIYFFMMLYMHDYNVGHIGRDDGKVKDISNWNNYEREQTVALKNLLLNLGVEVDKNDKKSAFDRLDSTADDSQEILVKLDEEKKSADVLLAEYVIKLKELKELEAAKDSGNLIKQVKAQLSELKDALIESKDALLAKFEAEQEAHEKKKFMNNFSIEGNWNIALEYLYAKHVEGVTSEDYSISSEIDILLAEIQGNKFIKPAKKAAYVTAKKALQTAALQYKEDPSDANYAIALQSFKDLMHAYSPQWMERKANSDLFRPRNLSSLERTEWDDLELDEDPVQSQVALDEQWGFWESIFFSGVKQNDVENRESI